MKEKKKISAMSIMACVWMGLFPLAQGGTYQTITRDKWNIMIALTALTILALVIDLFRRQARIRITVPGLLALFFLACVGVSCYLSNEEGRVWLMGASARREGLITQVCYLAVFYCFLFGRVNHVGMTWASVAGLAGFFAVVMLQRAGQNPFGLYPAGRSYAVNPEFQGTIGNVDMCTGYLVMTTGWLLPELFSLFRERKNGLPPFRLIAVLAGIGMGIYLIITMEVQFGLIALAAVALYLAYEYLPRSVFISGFIMLLVLGLLVVWFWPGQEGGLWELHEIMHLRGQLSFGSNRVAVWYYSMKMILGQPLPGTGSDTFELRFNRFLRENQLVIPTAQGDTLLPDYFDNPHNDYIAQMSNHGVAAVAALVILILIGMVRSKKRHNSAGAALAAYAAQAIFSFSVAMVSPFFWLLLGIGCHGEKNDVKNIPNKDNQAIDDAEAEWYKHQDAETSINEGGNLTYEKDTDDPDGSGTHGVRNRVRRHAGDADRSGARGGNDCPDGDAGSDCGPDGDARSDRDPGRSGDGGSGGC